MDRRKSFGTRQNDLVEQLEQTEQSISLVLREIDRSFAAANRIVSQHMLPEVLKYKKESETLWSRVGVWKHFLEESAKVSLGVFEEDLDEDSGLQFDLLRASPEIHRGDDGEDQHLRDSSTNLLTSPLHGSTRIHGQSTTQRQFLPQSVTDIDVPDHPHDSAMSTTPFVTAPLLTAPHLQAMNQDTKHQSTVASSIFTSSTSVHRPLTSNTQRLLEHISESATPAVPTSSNLATEPERTKAFAQSNYDAAQDTNYNDHLARVFDHTVPNVRASANTNSNTTTDFSTKIRPLSYASPIRHRVGKKAWVVRATPSPRKRKKSIYESCMDDTEENIKTPRLESDALPKASGPTGDVSPTPHKTSSRLPNENRTQVLPDPEDQENQTTNSVQPAIPVSSPLFKNNTQRASAMEVSTPPEQTQEVEGNDSA